MNNNILSINNLFRTLDITNYAAFISLSYQIFNLISRDKISDNVYETIFGALATKDFINHILLYLFLSYLFSSIFTLILRINNFHRSAFAIKIVDIFLLTLNLFLLKSFLGNESKQLEVIICRGIKQIFPGNIRVFLPASQLCESIFAFFNQLSSSFFTFFDSIFNSWNIFMASITSLVSFCKPVFAILNISKSVILFLVFIFIEPIVFFSDILEPLGSFTADSETMKKRSNMIIALIGCLLIGYFSMNLLYYYSVDGSEVLFPSQLSLMLWILVGFSLFSGLYKIFTHDPSGPNFSWTITQATLLLLYQCTTIAALHEILMASGFSLPTTLWQEGTRLGFGSGVFLTIRLVFHAILVLAIFWAYLVNLNPNILDYLEYFYPEESTEEASESLFSENFVYFGRALFSFVTIFSKSIMVVILHLWIEKTHSPVKTSLTPGTFSYPSWLLLTSVFFNLVASALSALYCHWVKDSAADFEELEKERFLKLIQNKDALY